MVYIITDYWYHSHYFSHIFYPILAYENRNIIFYPIKVYFLSTITFPILHISICLISWCTKYQDTSIRSGCAAVEAPHWPRRPRRQGSDPGTIAWCSGRSWQLGAHWISLKMSGKWMENGWKMDGIGGIGQLFLVENRCKLIENVRKPMKSQNGVL